MKKILDVVLIVGLIVAVLGKFVFNWW